MSARSASQRVAQQVVAEQLMDRKVMDRELALAEERGAVRARAQVRAELVDMLEERRRVVRLGDQQIEIVEVAALRELFDTDL